MSDEYTDNNLNDILTEEEEELLNESLNDIDLDDLENESNDDIESVFDDSSDDSVFDEFFGDSDLFEAEKTNDLSSMLQIENTDNEQDNSNNDTELWHDYMDNDKLFTNPEELLQNAVDYTEKDFENVTNDVLIISGVTESFEVKALKSLADQPRNKEFGSSCFISYNDSLIEIGKMEICLNTFLYLMDLWNYDMYILTKTDEGRVQTKVDLEFLGLLLV